MRLIDLFPNITTIDHNMGQQLVSHVTSDSRKVEAGSVFVAIKGSHFDGHDFIPQALENGAIAIVAEDQIETGDVPLILTENSRLVLSQLAKALMPSQSGVVAAITGTNGKTSTADFLRQIWEQIGWHSASMGTLGIRGTTIGPIADLSNLTTPDAVALHQNLNALAKTGITNLAMEASSHGIEQDRLSSVKIAAAGFSNLSRDHLDHHLDMEAYFNAKARLFTELLPEGGVAVINIDDPAGEKLAKMLKGRPINIITIGKNKNADLKVEAIHPFDGGMTVTTSFNGQKWTIPIALLGEFQVENALMAAGLAHATGLSMDHALLSLPYLKPAPGRMQHIHGHPDGASVLVDYAHTPDALKTALETLRANCPGKLGVVFGCGGDRDQGKRQEMGAIAAEYADFTIVTDDNPRHEDPALIREAILQAVPEAENIGDRHSAIRKGLEQIHSGDVLLVAGKGHEDNQLIGSETLPFSDAAVISAILSGMNPSDGGAS